MAYDPGIQDRSGELFAAGINRAGNSIAEALQTVGQRRDESQASDLVMDFITRTQPDTLPKGEDGQVDAKFLEKFYGSNLRGKQQTLGMLMTQIMSPTQKAQVGYYEALADGAGVKGAPVAQPVAAKPGAGGWGTWTQPAEPLPTDDPSQVPEVLGPPMPPSAPAMQTMSAPPLGLPPPGRMSSANSAAVFRRPPLPIR